MWTDVVTTVASLEPRLFVMGFGYVAAAFLVMYLSFAEESTPQYETRRSSQLLQAARDQAEKLQTRDTQRPPGQRDVVCLGTAWEARWWSDRFGVSPQTLKDAIRRVGPMARSVERYLALNSRRPSTRGPC